MTSTLVSFLKGPKRNVIASSDIERADILWKVLDSISIRIANLEKLCNRILGSWLTEPYPYYWKIC